MKLLVCGCVHGRFAHVHKLQTSIQPDVTLLLGDLEAFLNEQEIEQSSAHAGHEIPLEYAAFAPVGTTIAIFGNHERLQHCRHESLVLQPDFLIAGTGTLKVVRKGRCLSVDCLSGITNTNPQNKFRLSDEQLQRINFAITPHLVLSHEWPDAAVRCNKPKVSRAVLNSHRKNTCDTFLGSVPINEQLVWLAAHMHTHVEGHIYEKGKCTIRFIALSKTWLPGGHVVIDVAGAKALEEEKEGVYIWSPDGESWDFLMPIG